MRVLLLDIETAPNTAYVWGLFKENIPLARLKETGYVMCWAAKWLGEDQVYFDSVQESVEGEMLDGIHRLLDEADAVIHYNGKRFDIPLLNREFLLYHYAPPAPYKQIDLLTVARNTFKFASNKLDHVAEFLGLGNKVKHEGFELWIKCMLGDKDAWKKMEDYNTGDVVLLEKVYYKMLPWIKNHPNMSLEKLSCPNCGGTHYHSRGIYSTNNCIYQRYQCQNKACGKWFRGSKSLGPKAGDKFVGVH